MITEAKFKEALKQMMAETPLEDINVTTLCARCHCHRQTFYYHYSDVYDLLAAILLSEKIEGFDMAKDIKTALSLLVKYATEKLSFLASCYKSAASDLASDFFYNKIMTKTFAILVEQNNYGLTKESYRNVARRFANLIATETGYWIKTLNNDPVRFERRLKRFVAAAYTSALPSLINVSKEERRK